MVSIFFADFSCLVIFACDAGVFRVSSRWHYALMKVTKLKKLRLLIPALLALFAASGFAMGPYSAPQSTDFISSNVPDPGVPFPKNPNAPGIYAGWANSVVNYSPVGVVSSDWKNPAKSLGPATAYNFDICSLGDQNQSDIDLGKKPGNITLSFAKSISNRPGPDFAVFENGMTTTGPKGEQYYIFAELAFVEVSTDGITFARFPSVSLNDPTKSIGPYQSLDPTNIYNLAGKHQNTGSSSTDDTTNGKGWGTPFDLSDILSCPEVISGQVNPAEIRYLRIVDIPGTGFYQDNATAMPDPTTKDPQTGLTSNYSDNHAIRDPWFTWGSGGFDLEAVGVLNLTNGDGNMDGIVDIADLEIFLHNWLKYTGWHYGDYNQDGIVNMADAAILFNNWLK